MCVCVWVRQGTGRRAQVAGRQRKQASASSCLRKRAQIQGDRVDSSLEGGGEGGGEGGREGGGGGGGRVIAITQSGGCM